MPRAIDFKLNDASLRAVMATLKKMGADAAPKLVPVMERATVDIVTRAKSDHYFVGTGKGADKIAREHELDFKNPDGSLRFKIRTANLLNSIQDRGAKIENGRVMGQVLAGQEYAEDVEFGAPGRRAFPFLRPAAEAAKPGIVKDALREMKKLVRETNGKG